MNDAIDDPVPRDVMALVVLHGLLSAGGPDSTFHEDVIANYTDLAYTVADELIARGEK